MQRTLRRTCIGLFILGLLAQCAREAIPLSQYSEYGFRYDPMKWVQNSKTLTAALVRTRVLKKPQLEDRDILNAEIEDILSKQSKEGALSRHELHAVTQTADRLGRLVMLGASPNDERLQKALQYVLEHGAVDEEGEVIGLGTIQSLIRMGVKGDADLREATSRHIKKSFRWLPLNRGCPWTPSAQLKSLWDAREYDDRANETILKGLKGIAVALNSAGCAQFNDPWSYLDVAGYVDHPLGRDIVERQLPMILRSQKRDGGWGKQSLEVFRALKRYGLLERLRQLPPMPADWRIVRSIPAPLPDLFSMAYHDSMLWVFDSSQNEVIALSPVDGNIAKRVKLKAKHVRAIGWWRDTLVVSQQNLGVKTWISESGGRAFSTTDAKTGKVMQTYPLVGMYGIRGITGVENQLVVADAFQNAVGIFQLDSTGERKTAVLGAPGVINLAAQGKTVWHTDWLLTDVVFRSDLHGNLLDWGTLPIEGVEGENWLREMASTGLARDGEHLWILDNHARQIHQIEKTEFGRSVSTSIYLSGQVSVQPKRSGGTVPFFKETRSSVTIANSGSLSVDIAGWFEGNADLVAIPAGFRIHVPANGTKDFHFKIVSAYPKPADSLSPLKLRWHGRSSSTRDSDYFYGRADVHVQQDYICRQVKSKPELDGRLSEWSKLPFEIASGKEKGSVQRFGVAWDSEHVYVAVRSIDKTPCIDSAKKVWNQDGIEIRLDARPEPERSMSRGKNSFVNHLPILVSPGTEAGRENIWLPAGRTLPEGTRVVSVLTAEGYNTELAVPVAYLNEKQGKEWQEFRLNFRANDFGPNGRIDLLDWKPDWRSPHSRPGSGTFIRG